MLAGLRGDDRGVQREQVRLLGDLVDDVQDLTDGVDARAQIRDDGNRLLAALLDAVDLADGLQDGFCAVLGVARHFLAEARRLVGVRLHLVDGDVHLVHGRARLLCGERERVDVLGDLLDRVGHLLDRRDALADALAELADVLGHLVVGGGHLQDGRARFLGAGGEHLHVLRDLAERGGHVLDAASGGLAELHLVRDGIGDAAQGLRHLRGACLELALLLVRARFQIAQGIGDAAEPLVERGHVLRRPDRRFRSAAGARAIHRVAQTAERGRRGGAREGHDHDPEHGEADRIRAGSAVESQDG